MNEKIQEGDGLIKKGGGHSAKRAGKRGEKKTNLEVFQSLLPESLK